MQIARFKPNNNNNNYAIETTTLEQEWERLETRG